MCFEGDDSLKEEQQRDVWDQMEAASNRIAPWEWQPCLLRKKERPGWDCLDLFDRVGICTWMQDWNGGLGFTYIDKHIVNITSLYAFLDNSVQISLGNTDLDSYQCHLAWIISLN